MKVFHKLTPLLQHKKIIAKSLVHNIPDLAIQLHSPLSTIMIFKTLQNLSKI